MRDKLKDYRKQQYYLTKLIKIDEVFMPIRLKKIIEIVESNVVLAEVQHYKEILTVYVSGEQNSLRSFLDKEVTFEMNYKEVLSWRILDEFSYLDSGIYNGEKGSVKIKGVVHNIIPTDRDYIIDIYIERGAEFISIMSSEIGGDMPSIGNGIEINILGLCIYPVYY